MSTLLEQASLVMIPSGYKEDVVYSQIPTNGNGDLSFTRASNGTRVNSAGLVEVCPWNFVAQSESIGTSPWLLNGATLTSGQTDPNGGTTAIKVELASGGNNYVYQGIPLTNPVNIVSAYLRADSATTIGFSLGGSNANAVNLTTSWQLFTFSSTDTSGGIIFDNYFGPSPTQQAKTFYIWGAQLNIGSTAKPYFPTTDRLNVPRLTYQNGGGGCPSLLLEKQSTNLLVYSEQFDQWSTNGTTTANAGISPDGTQNADRLNYTSGNIYWLDASINVTNGVSYTYSLYVKPTSVGNQFRFYLDGAFNDSTVITTDSSDWKRYTWTFTASATGSINPHVLLGYGYSSQSILVWGAQLEASTYPTSLINTTSASATRVADFATTNNISSLFGSTEGSFFIEMTYDGRNSSGAIPLFLRSSTNSAYNYATYLQFGTTNITLEAYSGGTSQAVISGGSFTNGQTLKVAFGYKANDFVLYVNGVQIGTDTSGSISANLSFIDLGTYNQIASTYQYNGTISEAVLFPTRLTNTQLAQLTA